MILITENSGNANIYCDTKHISCFKKDEDTEMVGITERH